MKQQMITAQKWFKNLRSGFPLEGGITRLDFNKLRYASRVRRRPITYLILKNYGMHQAQADPPSPFDERRAVAGHVEKASPPEAQETSSRKA